MQYTAHRGESSDRVRSRPGHRNPLATMPDTPVYVLYRVPSRNPARVSGVQQSSFRDMNCSIGQSLEVVGEWWSLLMIRDAFWA